MKKFKSTFLIMLILALSVLTSCDKDDDEEEVNLLVGSWIYSEDVDGIHTTGKIFTFYENYTGDFQSYILSGTDTTSSYSGEFDYSTEGTILSLTDKENETTEMLFSISENTLTLNAYNALVFTRI